MIEIDPMMMGGVCFIALLFGVWFGHHLGEEWNDIVAEFNRVKDL